MKKIALVFGLLLATPAFAADNAVIVTPGVGVTMKSKDIGAGVQAMQPILSDASGNTLLTTLGADAVSNTLTGIPVYSRLQFFNGTTWDRWQGLVTLAAETTKVIGTVRIASGGVASGSFASGSIASGAVASGAVAAGAIAAGAGVDGWDLTQGAIADASVAAGATGSISAKLRRMSTDIDSIKTSVSSAIPAGTNLIGDVNVRQGGTALSAANPLPAAANPYPVGAVPYTATATGTTGATTATLAGAASVTTYICGFSIRANATAAATGNATVTGVITATLNFTQWTAPNASGLGITEMIFAPCIPASAANTSVAVVSAAPGTGGVVSVTTWGYKL